MKRKKGRVITPAPKLATVSRTVTPNLQRFYFGAILLLVLITLLAFSNSFTTGFALDNQTLVLHDPRIQAASTGNLDLIIGHTYWWPNGESGLYRPLTTLSYLLNYAILGNGTHPAGYHWINFFLHATNVLLVFALVLRLRAGRAGAFRTAFCVALLWAVHPVLTESVTNIVGRADLLAGFAVLSGLLLYLKLTEATGLRHGVWLAGLALTTALGAFSKESAVVLPALIILYEVVCGGGRPLPSVTARLPDTYSASVAEPRPQEAVSSTRRMWLGLFAAIVPIGIMLWQRAAVLASSPPAEYPFLDNPIAGASFWVGRLTAIKVLARYLAVAVWPIRLSADYSYSQITLAHGSLEDWLGWLIIAGAVVGLVILWNRNRLAFFFLGFACLNLLPASNLLFPIGTIMAERFLYLPLVGLVAAGVIGLEAAAKRFRLSGVAFAILIGVIAAGFAVRTWIRNFDWTDDTTMAMAGVQTSPHSFKFHRLLAAQLIEIDPPRRDTDRAVAEADRAVAILAPLPDDLDTPGPWNLAAVCHRVKGDSLQGDAARVQYVETVRLARRSITVEAATRAAYDRRHGVKTPVPPMAAECYRTLASAYLHLSRAPEALAAAMEAQKIDPANKGAYEEIAEADLAQGRGEEAAIAVAEGMFAAEDKNLLTELLKLYQSGVDSKGCAVVPGKHGPTLNPYCAIVHRDLCEATRRIGRADLRRRMGCSD